VSVVLIFLDAEPFLDAAIASVRAQTLDDWELLLVDDGSRDGSGDTARRHAAEVPGRIRYLEHEGHANLGMSASRNLGMAHATSRYVTFLDADDVLVPDALRTLTALLERGPRAAMAYGPVEYWYSWAGAAARRQEAGGRGIAQSGLPAREADLGSPQVEAALDPPYDLREDRRGTVSSRTAEIVACAR
jgi:glycosyltransferase involved in cell wall biosynthesis